ncbi:MAG: hypothetical protein ACT6FD_05470 [Methanosarcinaceae archaeon]
MVKDFKEGEKILFELSGSKIPDRYALIKTGLGGQKSENWLFLKQK